MHSPSRHQATKGREDENFPVASWLLAKNIRPHIVAFYDFARTADDIADDPTRSAEDKIARLNSLAHVLEGSGENCEGCETAQGLMRSLAQWGGSTRHALDLIAAFNQDAEKARYLDWPELMAYCDLSANPVGRFLLDIHGEDRAGYAASDALCSALQILNHLQDFGDDFNALDRVYIPLDYLESAGLDATSLAGRSAQPPLRGVIDQMLDNVDKLIELARALPLQLADRRLAMESSVIVRLAARLSRRLRRGDPLADRVVLSKGDFIKAGAAGVATEIFRPRKRGDFSKR